ncbi:fimbria/pilus periplasmic chaperone [Enterobacter asburiae]|jgi:P pilus assembly chaperone PapD|uniref:fimbria/pilus periplasmic chaperone n=1 Tax=Enterobacter asburiae TaxID=61645 RepID=UPI002B77D395|nr:fimbria/pilus periplasmic chaperone [Enterobacter asburiae]
MKVNQSIAALLVIGASVSAMSSAQAAIALDRTRVVYPGGEDSISLNVANENQQLPYLAQSWIENEQGEKVNSPLIVLPPVQRVEPGAKTIVKIQGSPALNSLPQDRETLFYFNLREIPPRSNTANTLQIALQTKVKLFYRPAALVKDATTTTPWQEQLTLVRQGDSYVVHNPTPYYITINEAMAKGGKSSPQFKTVMVAPRGDAPLGASASSLGTSPQLSYINDYGGRPKLTFSCSGSQCKVISNKVDE